MTDEQFELLIEHLGALIEQLRDTTSLMSSRHEATIEAIDKSTKEIVNAIYVAAEN